MHRFSSKSCVQERLGHLNLLYRSRRRNLIKPIYCFLRPTFGVLDFSLLPVVQAIEGMGVSLSVDKRNNSPLGWEGILNGIFADVACGKLGYGVVISTY